MNLQLVHRYILSLSKNKNMVFEKKKKTKRTKNKRKKKKFQWRETKPGPPTGKVNGHYLLPQDN